MAFANSSSLTGSSTTPSTTVPSGATAGWITIIAISGDDATWATSFASKLPAGFTSLATFSNSIDGQGGGFAYKRLTGADSGSYTFSAFGTTAAWACAAFSFSGRDGTSNPANGTVNSVNTGATNITENANTVTAVAGDDLLWLAWEDLGGASASVTHTAPTGYLLKVDVARANASIGGATLDNASAGATGTVAGHATTGNTAGYSAVLARIPVSAGGGGTTVKQLAALGVG